MGSRGRRLRQCSVLEHDHGVSSMLGRVIPRIVATQRLNQSVGRICRTIDVAATRTPAMFGGVVGVQRHFDDG